MQTSPSLGDASAPDLLDHVDVVVACNLCHSTYTVPASLVRTGQQILASGCTGGSLHECVASYYASLVEPEVLDALVAAWATFERSAGGHGGVGVVVRGAPRARSSDPDPSALERWENEGGR